MSARNSGSEIGQGWGLASQLSPYIRQYGDEHRPAWYLGPRRLLDYLVVYIAEGTGRFVLGDTVSQVGPGDLFWVPPDTVHSMEGFEPGTDLVYLHMDLQYDPARSHWAFTVPSGCLDLSAWSHLMHGPLADRRVAAFRGCMRTHMNHRVGQLMRAVCAEARLAQPFSELRMSGLVLEMIALLLRGVAGAGPEHVRHIPGLEDAADRMYQDCGTALSLEELARACALSPSHFRHLFKTHFGVAPRTYLRHVRIQKAQSLMAGSTLTLSQIAVQVGFETVHSFSRAFRAVMGVSPSEYRNQ